MSSFTLPDRTAVYSFIKETVWRSSRVTGSRQRCFGETAGSLELRLNLAVNKQFLHLILRSVDRDSSVGKALAKGWTGRTRVGIPVKARFSAHF